MYWLFHHCYERIGNTRATSHFEHPEGGLIISSQSVFRRFLLTYLALVLLAVLGLLGAQFQGEKAVRKITEFGHQSALNRLSNNLTNLFLDSERTAFFILKTLGGGPSIGFFDWENIGERVSLQRMLETQSLMRQDVHPVLMYRGECISPLMSGSQEEFYHLYLQSSQLSLKDWNQLLEQRHYQKVMALRYSQNDADTKPSLGLFFSDLFNTETPLASMVVFVEPQFFDELIAEGDWLALGDVFLLNEKQQILYSSILTGEPSPLDSLQLMNREGYTFLEQDLNFGGLRLITRYPNKLFLRPVRLQRTFTALAAILLLLVGGGLSYHFSKRQYFPIRGLVELVSSAENPELAKSEFETIQYGIEQLLRDNDDIHGQYERQKQRLNLLYLGRVFDGKASVDSETLLEEFYQRGMIPPPAPYQIVSVYQEQSPSLPYFDAVEELETLATELKNLILWGALPSGGLSFLLFWETPDLPNPHDILPMGLKNLRQRFFEKTGCDVSFGVSSSSSELTHIPEMYRQSLDALDARLASSTPGIYWASQYQDGGKFYRHDAYVSDLAPQLINALDAESLSDAQRLLKSIFQQFSSLQHHPRLFRIRLIGVLDVLIGAIDALGHRHHQDFDSLNHKLEMLANSRDFPQIEAQVSEVLTELGELMHDIRQGERRTQFVKAVHQVVTQHLTNPQLSVGFVAQEVGLPVSTLSAKFKRYAGIGLLDYMHIERLSGVKKCLLKEPNLSVKAIGQQFGYWDYNAFIKIFKKYQGITPGRYRTRLPAVLAD
ncbi:MAG: helix-turn-helix domain-containing protein [Spirochaetales bacterium]|nr:helix-turn-helix domain-containing protein [Spirochaetales bacterium]